MASNAGLEEDDEDDYLKMTFDDKNTKAKETPLQRAARLKKEAAERGRIPSKAELREREKAQREAALATELDASSNKGAKMMAKMGYQPGSALGQAEGARTRPIELLIKDDKGGIGMDSEKKRKVREAAEALDQGEKRQKVDVDEFRTRNRDEREERRNKGQLYGAMKTLEGFENEITEAEVEIEGDDAPNTTKPVMNLKDVNILYRQLVRERLEKDRDRQMRKELNNFLSTYDDDDDGNVDQSQLGMTELDVEDLELEQFEALAFADRLEKVVGELRQKYRYCFWCKYQYPDAEMEGCPGLTEDEHG